MNSKTILVVVFMHACQTQAELVFGNSDEDDYDFLGVTVAFAVGTIAPSDSPTLSTSPSSVPSSTPTVDFYQDLTYQNATNLLGLTNSEVTIDLSSLVNNDTDEIQDLAFDTMTNELSLTDSNITVDLSRLVDTSQNLTFDTDTMELGLTDSSEKIDLSNFVQNLSMKGNALEISDGKEADLSFLRVVTLQASVEGINGDDTLTKEERRLDSVRRLSRSGSRKGDDLPEVTYFGNARAGWNMISPGRVLGMSIVVNEKLDSGMLQIAIADCTDPENPKVLGETLSLAFGEGRGKSIKFITPVEVAADMVLCFQANRKGDIDSEDNHNAASLVLLLEQW